MHTGNGDHEPKVTLTQVGTGEGAAGLEDAESQGPKRFFLIISRPYSRLPPSLRRRFYLTLRRVINLGLLPHVRHEHLGPFTHTQASQKDRIHHHDLPAAAPEYAFLQHSGQVYPYWQ